MRENITERLRNSESANRLHNIYSIVEHIPIAFHEANITDPDIYIVLDLMISEKSEEESDQIQESPLYYKYILERVYGVFSSDKKNVQELLYKACGHVNTDPEIKEAAVKGYYKTLLEAIQELITDCDKQIPKKVDQASSNIKESLRYILDGNAPRSDTKIGDIKEFLSTQDRKTLDVFIGNITDPRYQPIYNPARRDTENEYMETKSRSVQYHNGLFDKEFKKVDDGMKVVDTIAQKQCLDAFRNMYTNRNAYKKHMSKHNPVLHQKLNESEYIEQYLVTTQLIADTDSFLNKYIHNITPESVHMMMTKIKDMFAVLDKDGEKGLWKKARGEDTEEDRLEQLLKNSVKKIEKTGYISEYIKLYNAAHKLDKAFEDEVKSLNKEAEQIVKNLAQRNSSKEKAQASIDSLDEESDSYPEDKAKYTSTITNLDDKINTAKLRYNKITKGYKDVDEDGDEIDMDSLIDQIAEYRENITALLVDIDKQYDEYARHLSSVSKLKLSLGNKASRNATKIRNAIIGLIFAAGLYTGYKYVFPGDPIAEKIETVKQEYPSYDSFLIPVSEKKKLFPNGTYLQTIRNYDAGRQVDDRATNPLAVQVTVQDSLDGAGVSYIYSFPTRKNIPPLYMIEAHDGNVQALAFSSKHIKECQDLIADTYRKILKAKKKVKKSRKSKK